MVRLYVGNLPPSATTITLRDIFKAYSDLQDCRIMGNNNAIVTFETEESGIHAVNNLNGVEYRGFSLNVDYVTDYGRRKPYNVSTERNFKPPMHQNFSVPMAMVRPHPPSYGAYSGPNQNKYRPYYSPQTNRNPYNVPRMQNLDYGEYTSTRTPEINSKFSTEPDFAENHQSDYSWDRYDDMRAINDRPVGKRRRGDYFDEDYYGFRETESDFFGDNERHNKMKPLQPQWYDQPMYSSKRPYMSHRGRIPRVKSYIDEYEDDIDYSRIDPYPSYLKQYQS